MSISITPTEARTELVKALRSGEYKQGRGKLKREIGGEEHYCCLGVACDVYTRLTGRGEWRESIGPYEFMTAPFDMSANFLPDDVRQFFGFSTRRAQYGEGRSLGRSLALDDNDNDHKSFEEIASIIESEPEGLLLVLKEGFTDMTEPSYQPTLTRTELNLLLQALTDHEAWIEERDTLTPERKQLITVTGHVLRHCPEVEQVEQKQMMNSGRSVRAREGTSLDS